MPNWPNGPDDDMAHAILVNLPDLVVAANPEAVIQWVASVPDSLGWKADDLVGTLIYDLFAKQANTHIHLNAFTYILSAPGSHGPFEVTVVTSDGRLRELELMVTNATDAPALEAIVVIGRDITAREGALESLRQSEAWASSLLSGSTDLVLACDRYGRIAYVGPSVGRILGWARPDLIGDHVSSLVHPDDRLVDQDGHQLVDQVLGTGAGRKPALRFRHIDGGWRLLRVERTITEPASDRSTLLTCRDVTDDDARANLLTEQSIVLEHIARGAPVVDTVRGLDRLISRVFSDSRLLVSYDDRDLGFVCHAPGLPDDLVVGLAGTELVWADGAAVGGQPGLFLREPAWDDAASAATGGRFTVAWVSDLIQSSLAPDVRVALLREHDVPLNDEAHELLGRVSDLVTIAVERHDLQARMVHAALHDEVTGLPNRRKLLAQLHDAFNHDAAVGGLLYIDLDRIKLINDSLGHDAGDHLLRVTAKRFLDAVRTVDLVARVGGDEFVVLCPDLESIDAVARVAERITEALQDPIDLPGGRVVASASIGVVHVTGRADAASVLQDADLAMYEAKQTGRNRIARFHPGLRERAKDHLEVENALRDALGSDEMELRFQCLAGTSPSGRQ